MRRVDRVAFVSVEEIGEARVVLDAIGRQLVAGGYSVAMAEGIGSEDAKLARALLPVKRELARRKVLLVVDNLESVLPKPGEVVEAWAAELLGMIRELSEVGETRAILTSREAPPAPLEGNVLVLPALGPREGLELLKGVLRAKGLEPLKVEEDQEAVERLVVEVDGHARSLVLLGGLVAERGVQAIADDVRGMMVQLDARYPDQRERSLVASVRLSLRRLTEEVRGKLWPLAMFRGAVHLGQVATLLNLKLDEALELGKKLIALGLADIDEVYLIPDPALGTVLVEEMSPQKQEVASAMWLNETVILAQYLYMQQDGKEARHGARRSLTNFLAALARLESDVEAGRSEAGAAVQYATQLEALVSYIGVPRVLANIVTARRVLSDRLITWSQPKFYADSEEVNRRIETGEVLGTLEAAQLLRDRSEAAENAYPGSAHDRAMASGQFGRALHQVGRLEEALYYMEESRSRFSKLASEGNKNAAIMELVEITEKINVLCALNRLDEASAECENVIPRARAIEDAKTVAIALVQLASVRGDQGRHTEALAMCREALAAFESMGDSRAAATVLAQIGTISEKANDLETAENAYRSALRTFVGQKNREPEAKALNDLGHLYVKQGHLEPATKLLQQAIDIRRKLGDTRGASQALLFLGHTLVRISKYDDARQALTAAIAAAPARDHTSEPWKTWALLEYVERLTGHHEAARRAREQSTQIYRSYRTGGGEPVDEAAVFIAAFAQSFRQSGPAAARTLLDSVAEGPITSMRILDIFHAILDGNLSHALARAADLDHHPITSVELALILETLPIAEPASPPAVSAHDLCPCGSSSPFSLCHGTA